MPDITAEQRDELLQIIADAVRDFSNGRLSWTDCLMTMACCHLRASGVNDPRLSEIAQKASELSTAIAFMSASPN